MPTIVFGQAGLSSGHETDRPNIIFILSDDHAYQAISAYGHPVGKVAPTPNIDRIAQRGTLLRNAFCGNSICGPSRASFLTGKHSHINGFMNNGNSFDASQMTWPKLLNKAGYNTAVIGKWHLKSDPQGFDYYDIMIGQGHYYNPEFKSSGQEDLEHITGYATDIITEKAMKWLKQQEEGEEPFCLLLWHKAPHRNWMPAPRHHNYYNSTDFPLPMNYFDNYQGRPAAAAQEMTIYDPKHVFEGHDLKMTRGVGNDSLRFDPWKEHFGRMTDQQRAQWDAAYRDKNDFFNAVEPHLSEEDIALWKYQRYMQEYCGSVASVDDGVGQVLDWLEANGMDENTIVIYSSDQGFFLGEHGWLDKRFMYEESLRIPFLIQYGDRLQNTPEVNAMIQNIDLSPTLLEYVDLPVPEEIQGKSFKPILDGDKADQHYDAIYYHFYEFPSIHRVKRHYGVRTERYKLIHFYNDINHWELYDLEKDPLEMHNLIDEEAYAHIQTGLKDKLAQLMDKYEVPPYEAWKDQDIWK